MPKKYPRLNRMPFKPATWTPFQYYDLVDGKIGPRATAGSFGQNPSIKELDTIVNLCCDSYELNDPDIRKKLFAGFIRCGTVEDVRSWIDTWGMPVKEQEVRVSDFLAAAKSLNQLNVIHNLVYGRKYNELRALLKFGRPAGFRTTEAYDSLVSRIAMEDAIRDFQHRVKEKIESGDYSAPPRMNDGEFSQALNDHVHSILEGTSQASDLLKVPALPYYQFCNSEQENLSVDLNGSVCKIVGRLLDENHFDKTNDEQISLLAQEYLAQCLNRLLHGVSPSFYWNRIIAKGRSEVQILPTLAAKNPWQALLIAFYEMVVSKEKLGVCKMCGNPVLGRSQRKWCSDACKHKRYDRAKAAKLREEKN